MGNEAPTSVQHLRDMGFGEDISCKAASKHPKNMKKAVHYALSNDNIDTPQEKKENIDLTAKLKQLFSECRKCDFEYTSKQINEVFGGFTNKNIINALISPYSNSKHLLWFAVIWNNDHANPIQKRDFVKSLEMNYKPNFNLTNTFNCNIIHDLCMDDTKVDNDTAILLLTYFIYDSKCIDTESFTKRDNSNCTPLHYAVVSNKIVCVDLLLRYYNKDYICNIKGSNNKTIMQLAVDKPNILKSLTNHVNKFNNNSVIENCKNEDEKKLIYDMDDIDIKDIEIDKQIAFLSIKKVAKIVKNYDEKEYKRSIERDSNKKHLKGLNLNNTQLKTSYFLENQTLQFVFHLKEHKWQHPIPFCFTFKMVDDIIKFYFGKTLINNTNNAINYKISGLEIVRNKDENDLFIKNVMNTINQSNAIEQPFHIDIKTEIMSEKNENKPRKRSVTDLLKFAVSLILPTKAVVPGYKQLYPLEVYEREHKFVKEIDDEKDEYEKVHVLPKSDSYLKMNKNQTINIDERLSITIPPTECMHDFKIKVYPINKDNINDIRFEVLADSKYIEKKDKKPLIIKWILDKRYEYTKNKNSINHDQKLFKIYFYMKSLNIWCTGNEKQIDIKNNGHPLMEERNNKNYYYIEAKLYGAYDLHIRQQINFYDQYIDKFCFNTKYNKHYVNVTDNNDNMKGGRPYFKPIDWNYYGINIKQNESNKNLIKTGCIGFHSTSLDILPSILRDGLVPPGTILSINGSRTRIRKGHITNNKACGDDDFTNNIFISPSINYCSHRYYCTAYELSEENQTKYNKKYAHLALKVYVNPSAIIDNRETIGWKQDKHKIDPNYNNNELEWRIRNPKDVLIAGLCIYEENIKNDEVWEIKNKMKKNDNLLHIVRNIFDLQHAFRVSIIDRSNDTKIKLNKCVLPTTLIKNVKKLYLQQTETVKNDITFYDVNKQRLEQNKMLNVYGMNTSNSTIYINSYRILVNVFYVDQNINNKKNIKIDIDNISYNMFIDKIMNAFNININKEHLKMVGVCKNEDVSRSTKITQYSFNVYLQNNYNKTIVINIGKTPNQPEIKAINNNNNMIKLSMITSNDPKHYEYKYELRDIETNEIQTGVTQKYISKEMLIIKGIKYGKQYSIRIKTFNGVADSKWSQWKCTQWKPQNMTGKERVLTDWNKIEKKRAEIKVLKEKRKQEKEMSGTVIKTHKNTFGNDT